MPARIECLLLLALLRAAVCARTELVAENLLLRHQLAVLTRPTRRRPRLRVRDELVWLLAASSTGLAQAPRPGPTGDGRAVAPRGLAAVLAVAIARSDGL